LDVDGLDLGCIASEIPQWYYNGSLHGAPTLTINGMTDPLYLRLKQRAAAHRRSLNSEIIVVLEPAVAATPPDPNALLARADPLRSKLASHR